MMIYFLFTFYRYAFRAKTHAVEHIDAKCVSYIAIRSSLAPLQLEKRAMEPRFCALVATLWKVNNRDKKLQF